MIEKKKGSGLRRWLVRKGLAYKHEDQSSIPRTQISIKQPGAGNPPVREAERDLRRSLVRPLSQVHSWVKLRDPGRKKGAEQLRFLVFTCRYPSTHPSTHN